MARSMLGAEPLYESRLLTYCYLVPLYIVTAVYAIAIQMQSYSFQKIN